MSTNDSLAFFATTDSHCLTETFTYPATKGDAPDPAPWNRLGGRAQPEFQAALRDPDVGGTVAMDLRDHCLLMHRPPGLGL